MDSHAVIETLPATADERAALMEIANRPFEKVVDRIEPENEARPASCGTLSITSTTTFLRRGCCR